MASDFAGGTVAGEAVLTVDADTTATRIRGAVVDVGLAGVAGEAGRALARVPRDTVLASAAVLARRRDAVVDVDLAVGTGEALGTGALERVDEVAAGTAVHARPQRALVYVDLALSSSETRHADATKGPRIVQAGTVVLTRVRLALVHVRLASRTRESLRTVAREGAGRVHADTVVLARGALCAFVNILGAVQSLISGGAGAGEGSVDGASVTDCALMTWIRRAGIIEMTKQPGLSIRALAIETADAIDAGRAVEAGCACTVIDVDAAIGPGPAVHAYTRVTAVRIRACGPVVAQGRPYRALVHIQLALRAREGRWAQTRVLVHSVHAGGAILTEVARTVVDILLAMIASESFGADALVVMFAELMARASVFTR